jgi:drug/metabolite transporter (DMT)-like permease
VHYVLAPVLYNRSSIVAPAFVMAVATFVNPSLAPVWGRLFYSEAISPLAVAGLALALGANVLLLLLLRSRSRTVPVESPSIGDVIGEVEPALHA